MLVGSWKCYELCCGSLGGERRFAEANDRLRIRLRELAED